ncbi:hypothetical protein ACKVMT_06460 [Halobacteriales archaeon Cl-PHB]
MSTRVIDRVDDWDQRAFSGGHGELQALADEEFSGVVRAGGAELFMTKGTVVGIRRGSIEDFADASGTVFEAPYPALALLAIMQERNDEVRAQYYTEETPISEVDRTLEDGGFTGFVELSENVLSGDYYQVYHSGHSMSAAFVGEAQRLLTGDEAFETADDEVGIYEVKPVEVDAIEIPDAVDEAAAAGGAATDEAPSESEYPDSETADPTAEDEATGGDGEIDFEGTEPGDVEDASTDRAVDEATTDATSAGAAESGQSAAGGGAGSTDASEGTSAAAPIPDAEDVGTGSASTGSSESTASSSGTATGSASGAATDTSRSGSGASRAAQGGSRNGGSGQVGSRQPTPTASSDASHLETRSIPSLDPERTKTRQRSSSSSGGQRGDSPGRKSRSQPVQGSDQPSTGASQSAADPTPQEPSPEPDPAEAGGDATPEPSADSGSQASETASAAVEEQLAEKEAQIERLEAELAEATGGQDDLEAELEAVREERDELQEKVKRLETELERLEEEFGAATGAEERLTAQEALSGTDIFVRYHSKGDATLEKAHDGSVRRDDVTDNLRLEKHTQFDAEAVSVGGQAYDEFLEGTVGYQFVKWVVEHLLFEIRDTGHADALQTLYDALPKVDRAELNGVVNVVITEDGQETRTQEGFDVVLRDRMGNPLLVANLNDSRQAATDSMMEGLITSAERVGQSSDSLACAFLVTRSFFEPEALETASEATRGGLLSRDKRRSFVNLSRKRGYHLCLVEARNENFHLAVPEL